LPISARVDVVVSDAGFGVFCAAKDLTDEQMEAMTATNLIASIQFARAVVPYLRALADTMPRARQAT